MKAWGDATNATGQIDMLADMRAEFSRALGIATDFGDVLAERAQRCAVVVEDGTITHVFIEEPGMFEVSSADHVLAAIAKSSSHCDICRLAASISSQRSFIGWPEWPFTHSQLVWWV